MDIIKHIIKFELILCKDNKIFLCLKQKNSYNMIYIELKLNSSIFCYVNRIKLSLL